MKDVGTGIRCGSGAAICLALVGVVWHIVLWVMFVDPDNFETHWLSWPGSKSNYFVCEQRASSTAPACGDSWAAFSQGASAKCFRRFDDAETSGAAGARCREEGGHLAIIHSEAENRAVASLCRSSGFCWIGLQGSVEAGAPRSLQSERVGRLGDVLSGAVSGDGAAAGEGGAAAGAAASWVWADGSNLTYLAWHPDHPKSSNNEDSATVGGMRNVVTVAGLTFGIPAINVLVVVAATLSFFWGDGEEGGKNAASVACCSGCCGCAFVVEVLFCLFFVLGRNMTPLLLVEAAWAALSAAVLAYLSLRGVRFSSEIAAAVAVPPPVQVRTAPASPPIGSPA